MAQTTTTLWKGHGLEVRRQVINNAMVNQPTSGLPLVTEDIVEIKLVQRQRAHAPMTEIIALVFSEKQIKRIEKNPDSWAVGVIRQRLRSARNRALRCHNALTAATQAEARWVALAGSLGIRPDEARMVEVAHG